VRARVFEKLRIFLGTQKDRREALFENSRKFLIDYETLK